MAELGAIVLLQHLSPQLVSRSKNSLSCVAVFSDLFEEDVSAVWDYANSAEQYTSSGGTSLAAVRQQIAKLDSWLPR